MATGRLRQIEHLDLHVARGILHALHRRGGDVARLVEDELERFHGSDEEESVAAHVFDELELLEVEQLWDRSGARHDGGYVEPGEEAYDMVMETVAPYLARFEDHLQEGRPESADACLRGIGLGLHRFARESESRFREWAVGAPSLVFAEALARWREAREDREAVREMEAWIDEHLADG